VFIMLLRVEDLYAPSRDRRPSQLSHRRQQLVSGDLLVVKFCTRLTRELSRVCCAMRTSITVREPTSRFGAAFLRGDFVGADLGLDRGLRGDRDCKVFQ